VRPARWHHGLEREAFDVIFAIHFPWLDKLFDTCHLPPGRRPKHYGIPEDVPPGSLRQVAYSFTRAPELAEAAFAHD
jgi:sterol desaturase/sphingolipid hydroxylase (fatty acid hydroxylase superfamily)